MKARVKGVLAADARVQLKAVLEKEGRWLWNQTRTNTGILQRGPAFSASVFATDQAVRGAHDFIAGDDHCGCLLSCAHHCIPGLPVDTHRRDHANASYDSV